jgi:23S rRNA pseudouridine2605 synthase
LNAKLQTVPHERLHKVLARTGIGSRRQVEAWIKSGRIQINGKVAAVGDRIADSDSVTLDGRPVGFTTALPVRTRVLAYHKPGGELTTRHDPKGRRTVFDTLPGISKGKWIAIGRLDLNTAGLLLFTNNGELANHLMHPSAQVEREYAVRVLGRVSDSAIRNMLKGVVLEDGRARFRELTDAGGTGANHWYRVIIQEGRNREVRRLWESQGIKVSRLIRVRFGSYTLPRGKSQGQFWELDRRAIDALREVAGIKKV